eukprot:gene28014-34806_t
MKRIFLFALTNIAVVLVLGIVASLLGVNRFLTANGLNLGALLGYALIMGFGGAIISLLISKPMAKWTSGVKVIAEPANADEAWIVDTVRKFADKAGIGMPEVGIFEGDPNAFATGAFRDSALVAVSTGLLQNMTHEEIEAVIGHEVAHIANGDMVTMTLIQGVMNTFVVFISRVVGYAVDSFLRKGDSENTGPGIGYYVTTIVMDIVLGFAAAIIVAWFSRHREFRADAGAAQLMGRKQPMINALARLGGVHTAELRKSVAWTWRVKLSLSTERDLFARLRDDAEKVAIKVFADNLRDLLLAAPAGPRVVMGLDPGIRTGVKVAVVDDTGKLVETATVFPHEPRRDWEGSLHTLAKLAEKHGVNLIAIGNGTASRETDKLAADLIKLAAKVDRAIEKVVVSEAGASVYSASEYASQEMPDVDVSLRGAASIARRLQDPLAELVKIDPKSIGVGQYQHDVNQSELARTLGTVVEDCVNSVGVDLNTASVPLLSRVSGLSGSVAKAVVRWREANGAFKSRKQLMDVAGLGAKTFEQSAGFLRIRGGDN